MAMAVGRSAPGLALGDEPGVGGRSHLVRKAGVTPGS